MSESDSNKSELPIKRDLSFEDSDHSSYDSESSSDLDEDDPNYIQGYKCNICKSVFEKLIRYREHLSLKQSTCSRCKQVYFCNSQMKKHLIDCARLKIKKQLPTKKRPYPRYIRGLEENMKRRDMVIKEKPLKAELKKPE